MTKRISDTQARGIGGRAFPAGAALSPGALSALAHPMLDSPASSGSPPLLSRADKSNTHKTLRGPVIAVPTPFNRDLSLDLAALKENLRYLVEHGVRNGSGALIVGGAGGEFPMLSTEERCAVARAAAEAVEGRTPLVIGAQSTDQRVVLEMARLADDLGAYAIQLSPPYYYQPSDEDVLRWFRTANDSLKNTGILVYNTFWHNYNFPFEVLDKVVELDRVVGLKWATPQGGLDYAQGVARYAPKVSVVDNWLLWPVTYSLGGTGFISQLGPIWPECSVEIDGMLKSGKYQEATEAMRAKKWPWIDFRIRMEERTGGDAPPVKCALELCGRPGGRSRPPLRDLNPQEREELRTLLVRLGAPVV